MAGRFSVTMPMPVKKQERALDLSQQLPQEDALIIQGRYYQSINENAKAAEIYRTLFSMFPDSLDYGLRLASVQLSVKSTGLFGTLAMLRNLPLRWEQIPVST